ncbi:hypothetical protein [Pseudomonas sp. OV226]|uniref:hypothetical protein n=1 Tax=Pseudomonas sp. OV226 TaxID=2135588 RepID=UPI000D6AD6DF|nr:hypothetical protein [Pseudomonas sp. OV226]PWK45967.1 hypothetical protein C7534_101568 [Pseudomonas sp. OV226]
MSIPALFKSRSQRRLFLGFSISLTAVCSAGTFLIAAQAGEPKWFWSTFNDFLGAMVASGAFAIFSMLFIEFFLDPDTAHELIVVPPKDIEHQLLRIARAASSYKIYVRTGRYFRSKVLPELVAKARASRRPMTLEIVLLDFRDEHLCERYAQFRKECSFDSKLWSPASVRAEILATVHAALQVARDNPTLMNVALYLSDRLSTFRIEGSPEEILVTREDPKDSAYRYDSGQPEHAAYLTEFQWIRDTAIPLSLPSGATDDSLLRTLFCSSVTPQDVESAEMALKGKAPYGR